MATISTTRRPPASQPPPSSKPTIARSVSRRKETAGRTDIWTSLLRQTREAQARSRTSAIHQRALILCGGSPDDQRQFVQSLARAPPASSNAAAPQPRARNDREREQQRRLKEERDRRGKGRGEWRLSNRYAYGYGHVTLYSPPLQQGAASLLGAEVEEVARLEAHTLLEPEVGYESVLRRLLSRAGAGGGGDEKGAAQPYLDNDPMDGAETSRRPLPAVTILLSWREPWRFLHLLRAWLLLLARALQPASSPPSDPLQTLQKHHLILTVVIQHVEAQELLEREGYTEESFDYVASSLRTCLLPLSAALLYTGSSPLPQPPGAPLTDVQKLLYTALDLPLSALSPVSAQASTAGPAGKKEALAPRHNVVDRMAVLVPSGWDSAGKIRLLSETFSPEAVLDAWKRDLDLSIGSKPPPTALPPNYRSTASTDAADTETTVFATASPTGSDPSLESRPSSPSKALAHAAAILSALSAYESQILNPSAHKILPAPVPTTSTVPNQTFLAELRSHLQELEAMDAAHQQPPNTGPLASRGLSGASAINPEAETSAGALNELLGTVSFNVGGVSYDTVSAERAIDALLQKDQQSPQQSSEADERAHRPVMAGTSSAALGSGVTTPRSSTPSRRQERARKGEETGASHGVQGSGASGSAPGSGQSLTKGGDLPVEKLEEYFASLMKKGSGGLGGASGSNTPSKSVKNGKVVRGD